MSVSVFIDQENYMGNELSPKSGARLVVHNANITAQPDEDGIELFPGTSSSIPIQVVITTKEIYFKCSILFSFLFVE